MSEAALNASISRRRDVTAVLPREVERAPSLIWDVLLVPCLGRAVTLRVPLDLEESEL